MARGSMRRACTRTRMTCVSGSDLHSVPGTGKYADCLVKDISPEGRQAISTVANIIQTLAVHNIPLSDTLITSAYEWLSTQMDVSESIPRETGRRMVEEVTGVQIPTEA